MIVPLHTDLPFSDDPYLIEQTRAIADALYEHACAINRVATLPRDGNYQYATPADGGSVQIADNTQVLILDPAGALTALTIALPVAPTDAHVLRFTTTQSINGITLQPASGQSISGAFAGLEPTVPAGFIYRPTKWYRI